MNSAVPPRVTSPLLPLTALLGLAALGGGVWLFAFDPERQPFYPLCLFHRFTGLDCPACGGLRAVHHLLHGEASAAFHYNPLFILSLPFAGWLFLRVVLHQLGYARPVQVQSRYLWALLCIIIAFGVGRNLG